MIKRVRKTDDEFRWLSIMPVKRNEVNKTTGKKVRPYLEYRYINIKASETPELLEQVNGIWRRHTEACIKGLEIRKAIKDIIASTFDIKQFESEQARNSTKYDWDTLQYSEGGINNQ
jgi:hypothetical protein